MREKNTESTIHCPKCREDESAIRKSVFLLFLGFSATQTALSGNHYARTYCARCGHREWVLIK